VGQPEFQINPLPALVGAIQQPFQLIQQIVILLLQGPAPWEMMLWKNHCDIQNATATLTVKLSFDINR
jgi:hypothetical protein